MLQETNKQTNKHLKENNLLYEHISDCKERPKSLERRPF